VNKYPRLRTYTKRGKAGQVWTWWAYDQRPHGPEIPLGKDYAKAIQKWDELHNQKARIVGRIQEAITRWRDEVLPLYESKTTRDGYTKNLKTIEAWCGQMAWGEVTVPMLRQYLRKRSAKVQGNREMSVLQIVWNYAVLEGITETGWPAAGMKNWKNEEFAREFEVTDALFDAVYQAGDQVLKDCMDIATTTGMRLTDARTCRMPVDGKLRFKSSKRGKYSFFEVSESPVLTDLIKRRGQADCVMLLTTSTGREVSASMLRDRYDTARMLAAEAHPEIADVIKAMYLRDCRKRAADLADDMESASKLLQHSSAALTEKHYRTKATKLKAVR
jgi:hypothetical protein